MIPLTNHDSRARSRREVVIKFTQIYGNPWVRDQANHRRSICLLQRLLRLILQPHRDESHGHRREITTYLRFSVETSTLW